MGIYIYIWDGWMDVAVVDADGRASIFDKLRFFHWLFSSKTHFICSLGCTQMAFRSNPLPLPSANLHHPKPPSTPPRNACAHIRTRAFEFWRIHQHLKTRHTWLFTWSNLTLLLFCLRMAFWPRSTCLFSAVSRQRQHANKLIHMDSLFD